MPKLLVERSILINAPVETIHHTLIDLNHWQPWSPWLIQDPDAIVEVAEDGKSYSWNGTRTGSGNMKIISETENESIDIDLNFLKPWKSHAKIRFEFGPEGDKTKVTWFMDSSLPFYLFWMKKMTLAFIGSDFERGLGMLKDYIETGSVPSKLDFNGEKHFNGCIYIGIEADCSLEHIAETMKGDYGKIWEFMAGNKELVAGDIFTIYHKWDMVGNRVKYTASVPLNSMPEELPDGFVSGNIPSTKVYILSHTGPYHHLGNAWSTVYSMHRAKDFKVNKKISPFEVYRNKYGEVPDNQLITELHYPTL